MSTLQQLDSVAVPGLLFQRLDLHLELGQESPHRKIFLGRLDLHLEPGQQSRRHHQLHFETQLG
jgi:hypothetical protein